MGFEQYRQNLTSFDRYYDLFLQNNFGGKPFKITLQGGDSAVGLPTSGSIVNPADPNVAFSFRTRGGSYRIPFRELQHAEEMVDCMVRTVGPHTLAASDFPVYVSKPDVERMRETDQPLEIVAEIGDDNRYARGAPRGTYKFLTSGGWEVEIRSIQLDDRGRLKLEITRP
jgi:hypothetical protein